MEYRRRVSLIALTSFMQNHRGIWNGPRNLIRINLWWTCQRCSSLTHSRWHSSHRLIWRWWWHSKHSRWLHRTRNCWWWSHLNKITESQKPDSQRNMKLKDNACDEDSFNNYQKWYSCPQTRRCLVQPTLKSKYKSNNHMGEAITPECPCACWNVFFSPIRIFSNFNCYWKSNSGLIRIWVLFIRRQLFKKILKKTKICGCVYRQTKNILNSLQQKKGAHPASAGGVQKAPMKDYLQC